MNKIGKIRLAMLIGTMGIGYSLEAIYAPVELNRPIVGMVVASEPKVAVQKVKQPHTIEEKIRATFPEDPDRAVAIAKCESGMRATAFNPKNKNGSWDAGVMQINSVHGYSKEYLFDVDNNLKVSYNIYKRNGWNAWYSSKKCWDK